MFLLGILGRVGEIGYSRRYILRMLRILCDIFGDYLGYFLKY
jgi:hypothetical protein